MNFTREPIIETIITPKEGYKLVLRNTKGGHLEEYSVDAVEVVSFGQSIFYRSLERPKAFLLPVGDYEIQETREMRIPLKNATLEKAVKIPTGVEKSQPSMAEESRAMQQDKKSDRGRKNKKKKEIETQKEEPSTVPITPPPVPKLIHPESGGSKEKEGPAPSILTRLFPPPTSLISDSISKYKQAELAHAQQQVLQEHAEESQTSLARARDELILSLEVADGKLDHIWTVEADTEQSLEEGTPYEDLPPFHFHEDDVLFSLDEQEEVMDQDDALMKDSSHKKEKD
ncbi:MAG: hypothetical protein HY860_03070 [Chlamydiales bacterium]|nr:hypothetical protein [Chlamydiales bacterium]